MRSIAEESLPFAQGLVHEVDVALLEVAQAAMQPDAVRALLPHEFDVALKYLRKFAAAK